MASDIDNSSDEMEQQERPESPDLPTESHNPPATETESPIEADGQVLSDPGSSAGSPPHNEQTSRSLNESIYQHYRENGRTYHRYKAGTYFFPNDPTERDRLDFQHEILKYAFSDKNYFAPLEHPRTILDIGTGTGQWAIEMGDEFPDAEVQGTDLSPIQPSSVPRNVHFFVDDASEPDWVVPPSYFDYIHTRVLLGSFTDFKDIIARAFHYLKPGGYMESQEIMPTPYCDDGTMPDNWPFKEWMATLDAAAMQADRPLRIANRLKRWYQEAGFVDVQEVVFKMPMNQWPRDRHLKILGRMSEDNWLSGLQALSLAPFSRTLSWSKDEIEVYLVDVRKAISDRDVHAYHKIYVVWGRKPEEGEPPGSSRPAGPSGSSTAAS